jgi:DNA-binding winged helix-turn-helix (wHTH) protein/TolB-like protein/Tfp pilus assembly protein PilF
MGLKTGCFYEFGEFRLEPDERLLARNSQPIPLAPKAFDLLVLLVQNSGRLVTKDQIMQAVWPRSFVEEANLTVTVSTLRKALGNKERGSEHIETVPKGGYRFVAPVREVDCARAEVAAPEENVQESARISSLPPTVVVSNAAGAAVHDATPERPEAPRDVNGLAAVPQSPTPSLATQAQLAPPPAMPASATGGSSYARRYWVLIALLAIAVALGTTAYVQFRRPISEAELRPRRSLAILPLRNLAQDPNSEFLGFSLADALITKLNYVSSLSVRPSSAVERYRQKNIDIQSVGADLHVDTLLTGGYLRDGDDLRITYQLIDINGEKLLGGGSIDLKYDNLLRVQDTITDQIIRRLKLTLSPAEAARIKPETSVSPLAYEYYLRGVDLHGQHKFSLAIKMLEKSTEIDPDYALAWAYLGASYTSDAAFELGGQEQYRRAQAAYERALAVDPQQLDARMFWANQLVDTGRVETAVSLLRDAMQTNVNYAPLHWELGYAYRFAGMLNESIAECERALQLDPSARANGSVLNAYLYRGLYDKFLSSLPVDDGSAFVLFYRGFGEYYQKDWERAERDFDRAFQLDPSLYTRIGKALSDSISQRNLEGLQTLRDLEQEIALRGVGDPEGIYKIAQSYAALGDRASALRVLRSSVAGGFFPYPYLATDPLLEPLHKEPEFAQILNISQRRYQAFKNHFF